MGLFDKLSELKYRRLIQRAACDNDLEPDEDFKMYGYLIRKGEYVHAIFHLSRALVSNPMDIAYLKQLESLRNEDDILTYFNMEDNHFYGTVALFSYFLFHKGFVDQAFSRLLEVIILKPKADFRPWLVQWLQEVPPLAIYEGDYFNKALLTMIQYIDKCSEEDFTGMATVFDAYCTYVEGVLERNTPTTEILMSLSFFYRRIGQLERSLGFALDMYKHEKSYLSAVAIAVAYKYLEQIDQAIQWYEKAHEFDETETNCLLDIGDLSASSGDFDTAVRFYGKVLKMQSEDAWAFPSFYACKYMQDKNILFFNILKEYCEQQPDNERGQALLEWVDKIRRREEAEVFVDYFIEPYEASINLLKDIIQKTEGDLSKLGKELKITLSTFEAPSSILCIKLYLMGGEGYGLVEGVQLLVQHLEMPDGRLPVEEKGVSYWKYEGFNAIPLLPCPPNEILAQLYDLAQTPYQLEAWFAQANVIAQTLTENAFEALLAACTYIPNPPTDMPIWNWVIKFQYAAVFVIANLKGHMGYLEGILLGQEDWPMNPAIVALTKLCQEDGTQLPFVSTLFEKHFLRFKDQNDLYKCYCLVKNWVRLDISDTLKKELNSILLTLETR